MKIIFKVVFTTPFIDTYWHARMAAGLCKAKNCPEQSFCLDMVDL
jgi:hypothetical protein